MFQQNTRPNNVPVVVPTTPMLAPVIRNTRIMLPLLAPIVRNTAISAFFDRTSMIMDEIMLKAATRIISVNIKNITLRSTRRAFKNPRLRSIQSNALKLLSSD